MKTFRSQEIVVMGGAGFLGSHLCERLLAAGARRVIALDNLITGDEQNLRSLRHRPEFEFRFHDVTDPFAIPGPVHYVFNLASPASPIDYAQLPLETLRAGSLGTENGLKLARDKGATFLQASTSEIYGDPLMHPQREDYFGHVNPIGPRSVYDEAKRYGEAMVMAYRRSRDTDTRIARIFNTYGPRMRLNDGRVIPAFVGQALRREPLTLFGDGSQTRSFCFVSDLIEGLCRLALSEVREPVNLGNPEEWTMLELADAVSEAIGVDLPYEFRPLPTDDPKQRRPDITRARTLLGWEPRIALSEGLRETIPHFRGSIAAREPMAPQPIAP